MNTESMYTALGITPAVHRFGEEILAGLRARFDEIDRVAEYNQCKVIGAMQKNRVDATHFAATTGYGYNDAGRDNLERVYADCFHTEAALVRPQITCGTHALTVALSANLLPGDTLLSPVGAPYDTLEEVIGIRPSTCSLKEYGVHYRQVDLLPDYSFDYPAIEQALRGGVKLVTIQRSKGYATRPTFSVQQIGELIAFCKRIDPNVICMVDNCYGEFVERIEPSNVGADMIVGSLIKNPGGGLAPTGGYIAGRADLVQAAAQRLTVPGIGGECGCTMGNNRALYERLTETPVGGVQVVGFTQEMPLYMAAADICVTKPGGLTCTEMLVSGCPSVLLLAVPGCESRNLEYFSRTYGTPGAADWSSAIEKALRLLDEPDTLRRMTERLAAGRMTVPAAVAMFILPTINV